MKTLRDTTKEAVDRVKYVRKQKEIVETENERLRAQLTGGRPEATGYLHYLLFAKKPF